MQAVHGVLSSTTDGRLKHLVQAETLAAYSRALRDMYVSSICVIAHVCVWEEAGGVAQFVRATVVLSSCGFR
jgi:hypothetical protein